MHLQLCLHFFGQRRCTDLVGGGGAVGGGEAECVCVHPRYIGNLAPEKNTFASIWSFMKMIRICILDFRDSRFLKPTGGQ